MCRMRHTALPFSSVHVNRNAAPRDLSCNSSTAKFFVGGNWKCNGTTSSIDALIKELNSGSVSKSVDVVCSPPFCYLSQTRRGLDSTVYQVAAQNISATGTGAYTGEVCGEMLVDLGVQWVIIGHSERRALYGDTNEAVNKKCVKAESLGLSLIPCIGETLEQRTSGELFNILDAQCKAIADGITDWSKVVIAYEPVWAIGTGVVATPAQAQEVHKYLRQWFTDRLGKVTAESLRIIYGGSVNDQNCVELAQQPDIDGFLVGGASLKGSAFIKICNANSTW